MMQVLPSNNLFVQNNLCNLLRVRARLVEKQHSLYKLHANYGRVFSEWSAIEKGMGDELQVFLVIKSNHIDKINIINVKKKNGKSNAI